MYCKTTVKLVVAESPRDVLSGVRVALFDRDRITPDDLLGTEVTDRVGEACFNYDEATWMDLDDRLGGPSPELFAVVFAPGGDLVVSTRAAAIENRHRRQITVAVEREVAARHGLLATA